MSTSTELPISGITTSARSSDPLDQLSQLKRQLLKAQVRLAKARAAVSGAEADVKVLNAKLRAFTK